MKKLFFSIRLLIGEQWAQAACDRHIPSGVTSVRVRTVHLSEMCNIQFDHIYQQDNKHLTWRYPPPAVSQTVRHPADLWPWSVIGCGAVRRCLEVWLFISQPPWTCLLTVISLHFCGPMPSVRRRCQRPSMFEEMNHSVVNRKEKTLY